MKSIALIIATSVAVSTAALAQQPTVRGSGAAQSHTAVSADRRGASAASDSSAQGSVAAERGTSQAGSAGFAQGTEMNATLERSIDARRAKPGDEVTAKTSEDFTTENGVSVPRGTKLVGHVTEARSHARGQGNAEGAAQSQLGIVFDKAVLKDGREVPMRGTIQAVAAAQSQAQGGMGSTAHDTGAFGASRASGGGLAGGGLGGGAIGGLGGGVAGAGGGLAGGVAGSAAGAVHGASRLPRPSVGAAASGVAGAAAHGSTLIGSSTGAVGGLNASGQWLAGSRGVFGLDDLSIASAAAGSAQGSLITSASRNVRLDGGTQLLVVGHGSASR